GCTKYPWRVPVALRKIIFEQLKLRASFDPNLFAMANLAVTYCATRGEPCPKNYDTLHEFESGQVLAYLDWFEGAKHYV
ncbi:hypothetical protein PFISCL1PPCAC_1431, partial [Pristionchus fissidentatus]